MWRVPRWRPDSGRLGRRGTALLLAIAIEALVVLLLLFLVPPIAGRKDSRSPTVFSVDATDKAEQEEAATPGKARPVERTARAPSTPPPPEPPPPEPPKPNGEVPFIVMTHAELRAADIANMRSSPAEPAPAAAPAASGSARAGDSPIVGKAPNGEPLYAAEWYRRPRQIELDPYLPRRWAREGSGLIACRTAARYRVEDCKILGERPSGSGYGFAVLQASFQFLVRPPRIGGKEKVGEWVSIRIDYTVIAK